MAKKYSVGIYGAGLYGTDNDASATAISCWSFSIDGHSFVFVRLGAQGTFVYDVLTGEWYEWSQNDVVGLGFNDGQSFSEFYLMGSSEDGTIYSFCPDENRDYSSNFKSVVTGGIPARGRETIQCYAVHAAGNLSEEGGVVSLYYSDDNGKTWQLAGSLEPDSEDFDINWRSLGLVKYPGRLFQIEDDGAMKSIDGLSMETENVA